MTAFPLMSKTPPELIVRLSAVKAAPSVTVPETVTVVAVSVRVGFVVRVMPAPTTRDPTVADMSSVGCVATPAGMLTVAAALFGTTRAAVVQLARSFQLVPLLPSHTYEFAPKFQPELLLLSTEFAARVATVIVEWSMAA